MHGLPPDTDLQFIVGAELTQVCIGQNEVILNLFERVSFTLECSVSFAFDLGGPSILDKPKDIGIAALRLLGEQVRSVEILSEGTLKLAWGTRAFTEFYDSSQQYESYTITHGEEHIVV